LPGARSAASHQDEIVTHVLIDQPARGRDPPGCRCATVSATCAYPIGADQLELPETAVSAGGELKFTAFLGYGTTIPGDFQTEVDLLQSDKRQVALTVAHRHPGGNPDLALAGR